MGGGANSECAGATSLIQKAALRAMSPKYLEGKRAGTSKGGDADSSPDLHQREGSERRKRPRE